MEIQFSILEMKRFGLVELLKLLILYSIYLTYTLIKALNKNLQEWKN